MRHVRNKTLVGLSIAVAIALGLAIHTGTLYAQADPEEALVNAQVGTFNPEAAFQQHPAQAELMNMMGSLQAEMEEAQMEGDQQRMQQLQQQFEQQRMQSIDQFHDDLDAAMPEAADRAEVSVIAVEVRYTTDDIQTKDITQEVIEALADVADMEDMPAAPGGMLDLNQ